MIVIQDWETTDKVPSLARGVQFAALALTDEGEFIIGDQLCNPGEPIHPGASEVHGITDEMVLDAEPDSEVAHEYRDFLAGVPGVITAGHNSLTFDNPITDRLSEGNPHPPVSSYPHIDTMILAQRVYPNAPNHKLSDLVKWLELGDGEGAHDALADVRMVGVLIQHFSEKTGKTPFQLAEWIREPFVYETCHFGKHKGKDWKSVPIFYVKWMTQNWTDPSPDLRATIKHHFNLEFSGAN